MRPVRLRFSGLHSYREPQDIDFTELTDLGLFGIFGPTGSGKSTVLDAITLALYGRVERAGARTHGIINQAENKLQVSLVFELDSREGRQRYRVERVYNKADEQGATPARSSLSMEVSPGSPPQVLAEGVRQVNARVESLLGLNSDDFTRAVVLPQGRFAEFLQLKGTDRRKMLERLFGLEQYGEALTTRVKSRIGSVSIELEKIAAAHAALGDASPEACDRLLVILRSVEKERSHRARELKVATDRLQESQEIWRLQEDLQAAKSRQQGLQAEAVRIEFMALELADADRAEQTRPYLETEERAREEVAKATESLSRCETDLSQAATLAEAAHKALEKAESQKRLREPELTRQRFRLEQAQALEGEITSLSSSYEEVKNQIEALRLTVTALEGETATYQGMVANKDSLLQSAQKEVRSLLVPVEQRDQVDRAANLLRELKRVTRELAEAYSRLEDRKTTLATAKGQALSAEAKLRGAKEETESLEALLRSLEAEKPGADSDLSASLLSLEKVKSLVGELSGLQERFIETHERLESARQKAMISAGNKEAASKAVILAEASLAAARVRLQDAQRHKDRTAESMQAGLLARQLEAGEPCPVCGSLDHPQVAGVIGESALDDAHQALESLQKAVDDLTREHTKCVSSHAAAEVSDETDTREVSRFVTEVREIESYLAKTKAALPGGWPQDLPALKERIESDESGLRLLRQAILDYETNHKALREKLTQAQTLTADARSQAARAEALEQSAHKNLQDECLRVDQIRGDVSAASLVLDSVRGDLAAEEIEPLQGEIRRKDQKRGFLEKSLPGIEEEREQARRLLEDTEKRLRASRVTLDRLISDSERCQRDIRERWQKRDEITGGVPTGPLLASNAMELGRIAQILEESRARHEECDALRRQVIDIRARTLGVLNQATAHLESSSKALRDMLLKSGFVDVPAARAMLRNTEQRNQIRTTVDEYRRQLALVEGDVLRLTKALAGRVIDEGSWQRIQGEVQELKKQNDEAAERLGAAQNQYTEALGRREQWERLESSRQSAAKQHDLLRDLESVLRGNAFVDFVAEEQLVAIARDASQRLGTLTRFRYALEVDSEGAFIIRDDHNGGIRRPVSTLSGGETFLTSLALALALSSQIQLRGESPLEFFFLDEGFGTLDPDTLELVLDALDRLRHERLAIGLISHVPEFRNRISRRIIVEPAVPGGSSRLRVEAT